MSESVAAITVDPTSSTTTRPRGRQKGEKYKRGPAKLRPGDALIQLISARQAESESGIPYTTLRKLHFNGAIPVVKFGEAWFFRRSDLNALIERNTERKAAR
jgi:hypothetical protein